MDLDLAACDRWIECSRAGDEAAFRALVEHVYPFALRSVKRNRAMGSLAKSEDHVNNVMLALVDKLSASGGRAALAFPSWLAENEGKTFVDWLRIVISFTVRDYVRTVLGRSAQRDPDMPSVKRLLNELTSSPASDDVFGAVRPPLTMAQTARQLLDFASAELPAEQMRALSMWLDDIDFGDIEEALGLADEDAARKLVRAGIATIRRRFAVPASG
jgi:DNA-directed RNA polymerase specialized sigma24 family protein